MSHLMLLWLVMVSSLSSSFFITGLGPVPVSDLKTQKVACCCINIEHRLPPSVSYLLGVVLVVGTVSATGGADPLLFLWLMRSRSL